MSENERIAKAAGFDGPFGAVAPWCRDAYMPDWRSDPGACATWLLPVLEKRVPEVILARVHGGYEVHRDCLEIRSSPALAYAPTFHEAIIAAILGTGETPNE